MLARGYIGAMRILSLTALPLLLLSACAEAPVGDGNEAAIAKAAADLERATEDQANGIVAEIEATANEAAEDEEDAANEAAPDNAASDD
jgi:hypothetical protein